jgi:hypothetical protein
MNGGGAVRGPLTLLLIVLVVLKLTGVVGWSWWLVLAPLWAPLLLGLAQALVGVLFIGVGLRIGTRRRTK